MSYKCSICTSQYIHKEDADECLFMCMQIDPNGAPAPDDNKAGREYNQMKKEGTK